MRPQDYIKLAGCHPTLLADIEKIIGALAVLGFTMIVTDGVRTVAQQQALFAKGRTAPGPIVTYKDGIIHRSNHQTHSDGFGHAVDCCFLVDGHASWDLRLPWKVYGACGEALGLTWGGNWVSLHDFPHLELP